MQNDFYQTLVDSTKPIGLRYQAVFQLKNIGTEDAIKALMVAYPYCGNSILLKHELLYSLGQLPNDFYPIIKEFLIQKMNQPTENSLSRHEAAEALANYFDQNLIQMYEKHLDSDCKELKWTCQIAKLKVEHSKLKQEYGKLFSRTMQPAAPFSDNEFTQFLNNSQQLKAIFQNKGFLGLLCCENVQLFHKYRVMYYMRNLNTVECREALCKLLSKEYFKTQTSLLKHEVCFIIGQIGCDGFQNLIRQCLENEEQEDIVRHQALAAVGSQSKDLEYLSKFLDQKYGQLIQESAEVAVHTIKYWNEQ